jgi:hypothetical protein
MQFLPTVTHETRLEALNTALAAWLDGYHQREHSSTRPPN